MIEPDSIAKKYKTYQHIALAICVVLFMGFNITKPFIGKAILENRLERMTGMDVQVEFFAWGFFTSKMVARNVTLSSPERPEHVVLKLRELFVEYDFSETLYEQLHIENFDLDVERLVLRKGEPLPEFNNYPVVIESCQWALDSWDVQDADGETLDTHAVSAKGHLKDLSNAVPVMDGLLQAIVG